jgi:hypothetical protein
MIDRFDGLMWWIDGEKEGSGSHEIHNVAFKKTHAAQTCFVSEAVSGCQRLALNHPAASEG